VNDFDAFDFFIDPSLVPDPHPYFDCLRAKGPVVREPHHGVVAVTGYDEAIAVYKDSDTFSNCIAAGGLFPPLPFEPCGEDISSLIEQYRTKMPLHEHMVTMDPPDHTRARSLLSRLLTPARLKENRDFLWNLADHQLDEFVERGECEFLTEYCMLYSLFALANLLGVPEADHQEFRAVLANSRTVGNLEHDPAAISSLDFLDDKFSFYIEERRRQPRGDVLSDLAAAQYPDGSTPAVVDVVRMATFLFGAGEDTAVRSDRWPTAKLLGAALQTFCDRPDLQEAVREDRSLVPAFIEETLRMESPIKTDFRLARKSTRLGGVDISAGTTVMVSPGAVNRDPNRFEDPHEFRLDRPNVREQIAFARGVHTCPGAPLVRLEGRVSLERVLDRMADIQANEAKHGPVGNRRYSYEPTYLLRGLTELHIQFTPIK
jgi:cytochrome P450